MDNYYVLAVPRLDNYYVLAVPRLDNYYVSAVLKGVVAKTQSLNEIVLQIFQHHGDMTTLSIFKAKTPLKTHTGGKESIR